MQTIREYQQATKKIKTIWITVISLLLILVIAGAAIGISYKLTNGFKPNNDMNVLQTADYGTFKFSKNIKFANHRMGFVEFESGTNFSGIKDLYLDEQLKNMTPGTDQSSFETRFPKEECILVFDLGIYHEYYLYNSIYTIREFGRDVQYYTFENDTFIYDRNLERIPFQERVFDIRILNTKTNETIGIMSDTVFGGEYFEIPYTMDNGEELQMPAVKVINSDKNIPLSDLVINSFMIKVSYD